jgi:RNA polymerase sigma-70 factor (ECF subfamily)
LVTPDISEAAPVAPAVLGRFCEAFNAPDLDRLTALLLDTAILEYPVFKIEYGAKSVSDGSFRPFHRDLGDAPRDPAGASIHGFQL